jgi:hypothetical protein
MRFSRLKSAVTDFVEGSAAAVLVVLAILLLLGGTLLLLHASIEKNPDVKPKDWIEFFGIWIASVGSAISVLLGSIIRRQQARDSQELEKVKVQFGSALAYYTARLSQITAREFEAYSLLWAALARFYRALFSLQVGSYDEDALNAAQKLCEEAEGHCLLVEESDRQNFYAFWHRSRLIRSEAEKVKLQPDALKTLWRNEIRPPANPSSGPAITGYYDDLTTIKDEFYKKLTLKVNVDSETLRQIFQA